MCLSFAFQCTSYVSFWFPDGVQCFHMLSFQLLVNPINCLTINRLVLHMIWYNGLLRSIFSNDRLVLLRHPVPFGGKILLSICQIPIGSLLSLASFTPGWLKWDLPKIAKARITNQLFHFRLFISFSPARCQAIYTRAYPCLTFPVLFLGLIFNFIYLFELMCNNTAVISMIRHFWLL